MEHVWMYLVLGAIIGVMSGLFGIGGGMFLTPILLLTGVSPVEAITISLFYTTGTSVSGMVGHIRLKNTRIRRSLIIGASGIAATQAAQPLVLWTEKKGFDDTVIPLFYLVLLLYFAYTMLKKGRVRSVSSNQSVVVRRPILALIVIGFLGGFVSSALGVGGGFIIVPLLITIFGESAKKAVGTSVVGVLMIVSAGFAGYALTTEFNLKLSVTLLLGGLAGAQAGVKAIRLFSSEEIKKMLGMLYIFTMFSVGFKLFEHNEAGLGVISLFVIIIFSRIGIRMFSGRKKKREETV
ncbi:sulfite exporter TauE/SafE family protein [Peribacillus deserti]|uniref:Probable membrane transporter protein n=1 Tax=Peribacillus deserti TaxID=673318 RepID=A0A2N5M0W4_9BACI|nr:sulfite exporter TauE/SafE family protein [Peribacillus deserti]PLT27990.1 sulfite exporter TauE/SafE family protein [Peribacillus deserti]